MKPTIITTTPTINLGNCQPNSNHNFSFNITNNSIEQVVLSIRPSCGCTRPVLDKETMGDMTVSLNGHSKVVHCARVNIEDNPLPFFDETFDYVLCSEVLEHMEVDPMYMLTELNRVTKTSGKLILTTPNAVSTWSITKMLRGIEPYFYMQYRHNRSLYRPNYEYSIHTLISVLKAAGFDGKMWTEDCFEEPNYTDIHKLNAAGYQLSHLGDIIFTVAVKQSGVVDRYPKAIYSD